MSGERLPSLITLDAAHRYETDKLGRCPINTHDYCAAIERHFGPLRELPITLWEIGVDRGGSLKMWSDYLPHARIIGIDIKAPPPYYVAPPRCTWAVGDVTDFEFGQSLLDTGYPDVVLDDGSHRAGEIGKAFARFQEFTRLFYVVEDLGTQYEDLHGRTYLDAPPFTDRVKAVCDELAKNRGPTGWGRVVWEPGQVYLYKA